MVSKTLITRCTGINNRIDPKRLHQYDPETGITELAEGVDIDIDDSGMVQSRLGQVTLSSVDSHSLFCDRGDAFVVQNRTSDAALYRINADLTLTGVRSSLTKAAYFSFAQVGDRTFYLNGYQNGVIQAGASSAWPASTYHGPDTLNHFSSAPIGHLVAYFQNRIWIAIDEGEFHTIYCSEPDKPGLFRMAGRHFRFGSHVRMMRPVRAGVWVSDSETTGFIAGAEKWDGYTYARKASVPAHERSACCQLVDLSRSKWKAPGLSAVWSSDEGLCIGTEDGQLIVATEDKLIYPTGTSGATVIEEMNVINTVI